MIEIYPKLFIGTKQECGLMDKTIHACKTCHKNVLGYSFKLDSNNPECLIAYRDEQLYLNLIDGDYKFISKEIINESLSYIKKNKRSSILIHCDLGISRSPTLGFIYMMQLGFPLDLNYFKFIYPSYQPKDGMFQHLKEYSEKIC